MTSYANTNPALVRISNLHKSYFTPGFTRAHIFRGLNLVLPKGSNIGVIGRNGAGKSTLLRLIAGIEKPTRGDVKVDGLPSPPKGLSGGLVPVLTGRDNAKFVCRIGGLDKAQALDRMAYIEDLTGIGVHFDRPVNTYSSGMKARLGFAINMAFEYDLYLFDELGAVGDKAYRDRASEIIEERKKGASFMIVSHAPGQLRRDCDSGLYLANGQAFFYRDLEEAIQHYFEDQKAAA